MRVLHILDHSVPLQSGYVFRTLAILTTFAALATFASLTAFATTRICMSSSRVITPTVPASITARSAAT